MISQVIVKMREDGKIDVESNVRNGLMVIGLLEYGKKALMQSSEQKEKPLITIPQIGISKGKVN